MISNPFLGSPNGFTRGISVALTIGFSVETFLVIGFLPEITFVKQTLRWGVLNVVEAHRILSRLVEHLGISYLESRMAILELADGVNDHLHGDLVVLALHGVSPAPLPYHELLPASR